MQCFKYKKIQKRCAKYDYASCNNYLPEEHFLKVFQIVQCNIYRNFNDNKQRKHKGVDNWSGDTLRNVLRYLLFETACTLLHSINLYIYKTSYP